MLSLEAIVRILLNRVLILFTLFIGLFVSAYTSAQISFESGTKPNVLLELYTSEGCSSCPPAERWLSQLKNKPELFSRIVPLAFHVDYWDDLGWVDQYAKAKFSKRQRQHKYLGNINSVYTPGVVKDGKEFRQWYNGFSLNDKKAEVGKLGGRIVNKQLRLKFNNLTKYQNLTLNVALLGADIVSEVESGENSGQILHHDFVVLKHHQYPKSTKNNTIRWQVPVPVSNISAPRYAIAVWVSRANHQPIQATGAWLH